jgi:hypothetical protein
MSPQTHELTVLCKLLIVHNQWSRSIPANRKDNNKRRVATHEDEAKFWGKVQRGSYTYEHLQ